MQRLRNCPSTASAWTTKKLSKAAVEEQFSFTDAQCLDTHTEDESSFEGRGRVVRHWLTSNRRIGSNTAFTRMAVRLSIGFGVSGFSGFRAPNEKTLFQNSGLNGPKLLKKKTGAPAPLLKKKREKKNINVNFGEEEGGGEEGSQVGCWKYTTPFTLNPVPSSTNQISFSTWTKFFRCGPNCFSTWAKSGSHVNNLANRGGPFLSLDHPSLHRPNFLSLCVFSLNCGGVVERRGAAGAHTR